MNRFYRPVLGFVATFMLLLVSACGPADGLKLTKATGTVTFKGSPFGGATVTFMFEDGNLATGVTDSEGKFKLTANGREGSFLGKAKVTITKNASDAPSGMPANPKPEDMFKNMDAKNSEAMKNQAKSKNELPDRYQSPESSGLTATVEKSGSNDFTFPLEDAK